MKIGDCLPTHLSGMGGSPECISTRAAKDPRLDAIAAGDRVAEDPPESP